MKTSGKQKLAFVTGGTGMVGHHIVAELLDQGWDVIASIRPNSNTNDLVSLESKGVLDYVELGKTRSHRIAALSKVMKEKIDCVFHVAGSTSHWSKDKEQQYDANVIFTSDLVDACLARPPTRFIFTSTGATLPYQFQDHSYTRLIKNNYVRTKRQAEFSVYYGMYQGLKAVIMHPIIVLGAYDYHSYSNLFRAVYSDNLTYCFPGFTNFTSAKEVAKAHVSAATKGGWNKHYVLGGEYTTWKHLTEIIYEVFGLPVPEIHTLSTFQLTAKAVYDETRARFTKQEPQLTLDLVRLLRDAPDVLIPYRLNSQHVLGYNSSGLSLNTMVRDCADWMLRTGQFKQFKGNSK